MSMLTLGFLIAFNLVLSMLLFWLLVLSKRKQQQYEQQSNRQFTLMKKVFEQLKQAQTQSDLKIQQLEQQSTQHAPSHFSSLDNGNNQIARLVRLGATVEDLVNEHQVPRGEAELLVSLREQMTRSL